MTDNPQNKSLGRKPIFKSGNKVSREEDGKKVFYIIAEFLGWDKEKEDLVYSVEGHFNKTVAEGTLTRELD